MNIFDRMIRDTIVCSACRRRFRPNLTDRPLDDGGVLRLFTCTRCGTEFPTAVISKRGVELTASLQALPITDKKGIKKLQRELKNEVTRP